ncbi:MAG: hypothetical protein AAF637_15320 [Pseudomonadota bacterium]
MPTFPSLARGLVVAALAASSIPAVATTVALPSADRTALEALLGKDVIGDPVEPMPLSAEDIPLKEGSWTYKIVGGKGKGNTQEDALSELKRDESGASWKYATGAKDLAFIQRSDDHNIAVLSEQDADQGVITRFSPAEPILAVGMKAGDKKSIEIAVKVYDLSSPKEVSHTGSLKLEYSYVGAYKVTVPAGTYDAALLKWVYDGSVGPASVQDTQYRFVAKDVGIVASIDKKKISALLLYHDNTNVGKVLVKGP